LSRAWSVAIASDLGFQKGDSFWFAETLLTQVRLSNEIALGGRLEYFHDADGVVAATRTPNGFQVGGASVNLDWQPETAVLVRTELRSLTSRDPIFSAASGTKAADVLWASSLAVTF